MIYKKLVNDFELLKKQLFWIALFYGDFLEICIKKSYYIDKLKIIKDYLLEVLEYIEKRK